MISRGAAGLLLAVGMVGYTYVGYPLLVRLAAGRRRPDRSAADRTSGPGALPAPVPTWSDVTVVVPALNEEGVIAAKVRDLRRQGVPAERILVVADGSTDRTAEIARACGARTLHDPDARGKSAAINRGVAAAGTEIVVFTDANTALAPGAVAAIVGCLREPGVAVAGGVKAVVGAGARGAGEGFYWRIESTVLRGEATLGATMGVPGELYGIRRALFRPIPAGVLNDDYHVLCDALVRRLGVRYVPSARAAETVSNGIADEFERRTRIAAGTWQGTLAHLSLGDPRRGWVALAFLSHRVLRSLVTPVLLPALLAGSAVLSRRDRLARLLLGAQAGWYGLGLAGFATDTAVFAAPVQFVLTNAATLRGAGRFLLRRQPLVWRRARRGAFIGERP